jgi:2-C-methyl-D-erythritol 4-phosphate cytidylyltransferase
VPIIPVKDTIKIVSDDHIDSTPDRATLRAVQTPQVFEASLLKAALQSALEADAPQTDDAAAVERLGKQVYFVDGEDTNIKITTPIDLLIAEAILAERRH